MLARTADALFWTARYMERADYLARLLETALRASALPASYGGSTTEWESAVASAGAADAFYARYGDANEETVRDWLAFGLDYPSSIRNCLTTARTNARAVRTALTPEMWDAISDTAAQLAAFQNGASSTEALIRFLEWVKGVVREFDGAARRTMLRNDAYWFVRMGGAIERADNTARILDVKYHILLPEHERVGGSLDYFQWSTILREVSANTAYRWVYRQSVKPWLVADLLILNRQMPRSLASCYEVIARQTDLLAEAYGRRGPAQRQARTVLGRLNCARIEDIFQSGLHEFITGFLGDNARLGAAIAEQYLI
jgi:uncharacterized alpha-E superfamily protein